MMSLFFILCVIIVVGGIGVVSGIMWFRQHNLFLAMRHYNTGVLHLQQGEPRKAIQEFETALQRQRTLSAARYGLGLAYLKQQRHRESISLLETAVQEMPNDAMVHCNLGWAYLNVGKLEHAQQVLEKAVRINPNIKEIYFNLGLVFKERGDREQAVQHCRRALQLDADYVQAQNILEELSQIRYDAPINLERLREALRNFDDDDTELMIQL